LSYVKLLGWGIYSTLWNTFGLPDVALALSHPHDFYFHELADCHPSGLEKMALSRNATRAFDYFEKMVERLKNQGYEFAFLSDVFENAQNSPELTEYSLSNWK
jgi:hypothetical protein